MALDPVLKELVDQLPPPPSGPINYPELRQLAEMMTPMIVGPAGLDEVASVEEQMIEGPVGQAPIRVYRPLEPASGTLHYIHGGGWAVGSLGMIDHTARRLCRALGMVVVTSTYRLAPEHPFPAAFDDSMAAARWVLDHAADLGGASKPVVISGDSAGGNLAAAIALALRDNATTDAGSTFNAQLLLYPAVDLRESANEFASRKANADPTLRSESLPQLVSDYTGRHDLSDPRISPLAAADLTGLPPAVIVVLSVDPLRDEAVEYAQRLTASGVETELIEFDNLTHGFVHFAGLVPASATATVTVIERLKSLLDTAAR